MSDVTTPRLVNGVWDWTTAPVTKVSRIVLRVPPGTTGSALNLKYYACTPTTNCLTTRRQVTPGTSGPLTLGAVEVPESIVVSIGDPSLPGSMVTQAVKLVNQA
jgi:hypothetical protein